jgi:hypothetical protein
MDFDVLPGPSLPELARTALARAAAATVSDSSLTLGPAGPVGPVGPLGPVPVRAGRDGSPLLLPATGSLVEQWLAATPESVTVSVPAVTPFTALRLSGSSRPLAEDRAARITACSVAVRSVEFAEAGLRSRPVPVTVEDYRAAAPDPLWRVAPAILRHLERAHMTELVECIRAHGLPHADWVIPRSLDRYGLELLVLASDGTAAVRLSFPDGPVASLLDAPASIRTVLTCRCEAEPAYHRIPPPGK